MPEPRPRPTRLRFVVEPGSGESSSSLMDDDEKGCRPIVIVASLAPQRSVDPATGMYNGRPLHPPTKPAQPVRSSGAPHPPSLQRRAEVGGWRCASDNGAQRVSQTAAAALLGTVRRQPGATRSPRPSRGRAAPPHRAPRRCIYRGKGGVVMPAPRRYLQNAARQLLRQPAILTIRSPIDHC
jgi:hypothetical protein